MDVLNFVKNEYKSNSRDQNDQKEGESWQQPLIFTSLEKHIGSWGRLDNSYIRHVEDWPKLMVPSYGGRGDWREALETWSLWESMAVTAISGHEFSHRCFKRRKKEYYGPEERQLNLGLVEGVERLG